MKFNCEYKCLKNKKNLLGSFINSKYGTHIFNVYTRRIISRNHNVTLAPDSKKYVMKPGDVKFYNVGDVHSPIRKEPVRLLRIEGKNLDNEKRSKIKEL